MDTSLRAWRCGPRRIEWSGVHAPFVGVLVKSVQSRCIGLVLIGSLVGLGGMACAQTVSTPLKPGLWVTNYAIKLNSVDSSVLLKSANAQMLKLLPANMQASAKAAYDAGTQRGVTKTCVTPQTAVSVSTPSALFNNFSKMNPLCKFTPASLTTTSLKFTGRCDDPSSFTGNVSGQLSVVNAWVWNVELNGSGKALPAATTALGLPANSVVQMRSLSSSRWQSAVCS